MDVAGVALFCAGALGLHQQDRADVMATIAPIGLCRRVQRVQLGQGGLKRCRPVAARHGHDVERHLYHAFAFEFTPGNLDKDVGLALGRRLPCRGCRAGCNILGGGAEFQHE